MPRFAYGKSADNAREEVMDTPSRGDIVAVCFTDKPRPYGWTIQAWGEEQEKALKQGEWYIDVRILEKRDDFKKSLEESISSGKFPVITCPKCGQKEIDFIGYGFIHCVMCGYKKTPNTDFNLTKPAASQVKS